MTARAVHRDEGLTQSCSFRLQSEGAKADQSSSAAAGPGQQRGSWEPQPEVTASWRPERWTVLRSCDEGGFDPLMAHTLLAVAGKARRTAGRNAAGAHSTKKPRPSPEEIRREADEAILSIHGLRDRYRADYLQRALDCIVRPSPRNAVGWDCVRGLAEAQLQVEVRGKR